MFGPSAFLTIAAFLLTILFIMWRPHGINEAIPASIGALVVYLTGTVTNADLVTIAGAVGGAAVTIVATVVMAIVLESVGMFHWIANLIATKARGSGKRLFWYVNLLCFLMTLFFNNDGSILMTTPILIILLRKVGLKPHQQLPYLISGAIIATASSAPIGVSNIVNLIALRIVGMTLDEQASMMLVPSVLGLSFLLILLYTMLSKGLFRCTAPGRPMPGVGDHPLNPSNSGPQGDGPERKTLSPAEQPTNLPGNQTRRMMFIFLYVFFVRAGLFVASYFGIPVPVVAVIGSALLLCWRSVYLKKPPTDMLRKTPWHIFVFAFCMYVLIIGLQKIGFTAWLVHILTPLTSGTLLQTSLVMGILIAVMSNLFNNHPALMIGTLTLTHLGLQPMVEKVTYLANIIGSDVGSLILPTGTLATLIWMHILRENKVKVLWRDYIRVSLIVIPPTVLVTIFLINVWVKLLF